MHPALLIDEILQFIFEVVLNVGGKSSLCCVARCCLAWKDLALDRIWRRLPSAVPLLSLLPGFSLKNGIIRLDSTMQDAVYTTFRSYATRVKHIVHCHRALADPRSIPLQLCHQLSNLESARIESRAIGEVTLCMSLAPRLRALVLQISYTKSNSTSMTVHGMMSLLKGCSSLEQLSVRGHSSECLYLPLSNVTTLRSLSLHLSSLTGQSFVTVSAFPFLVDFDVHADRLSDDFLSTAITCAHGASFFPALEKLKIRAQPTLVALILQRLPQNKLHSLHIDVTGAGLPSAFEGLFNAMTAFPLHEFTLEHAIPIDESEHIPAYTTDRFFILDHLRPLSKLPIRSFVLDSLLPPNLSDPDIEEISKWWPLLERLELGARSALENTELTWIPRNSLASLYALAKGCKHLKSLVITLGLGISAFPNLGSEALGSHPLRLLSISSRSQPDIPVLLTVLSKLFPSLVDVMPGFVGEHGDAWVTVQAAVASFVLDRNA